MKLILESFIKLSSIFEVDLTKIASHSLMTLLFKKESENFITSQLNSAESCSKKFSMYGISTSTASLII